MFWCYRETPKSSVLKALLCRKTPLTFTKCWHWRLLAKMLNKGSQVSQQKSIHPIIQWSRVWILMMPQPSKIGFALGKGGVAYSLSPIRHSDASQSWVSVSSCMRKGADSVFLWVCYASPWCCINSSSKRCIWLASCASEEACDSLRPPWLVAVVW